MTRRISLKKPTKCKTRTLVLRLKLRSISTVVDTASNSPSTKQSPISTRGPKNPPRLDKLFRRVQECPWRPAQNSLEAGDARSLSGAGQPSNVTLQVGSLTRGELLSCDWAFFEESSMRRSPGIANTSTWHWVAIITSGRRSRQSPLTIPINGRRCCASQSFYLRATSRSPARVSLWNGSISLSIFLTVPSEIGPQLKASTLTLFN